MPLSHELANLHELHTRGFLSAEEYERAKAHALSAASLRPIEGRLDPTSPAADSRSSWTNPPQPPGPGEGAPLQITDLANGMLRLNRPRPEAETAIWAAGQALGLRVTCDATGAVVVNGKTWKHNAAKVSLRLQEEPGGSTLLIPANATAHLGPGAGKLLREFVAALRAVALDAPPASRIERHGQGGSLVAVEDPSRSDEKVGRFLRIVTTIVASLGALLGIATLVNQALDATIGAGWRVDPDGACDAGCLLPVYGWFSLYTRGTDEWPGWSVLTYTHLEAPLTFRAWYTGMFVGLLVMGVLSALVLAKGARGRGSVRVLAVWAGFTSGVVLVASAVGALYFEGDEWRLLPLHRLPDMVGFDRILVFADQFGVLALLAWFVVGIGWLVRGRTPTPGPSDDASGDEHAAKAGVHAPVGAVISADEPHVAGAMFRSRKRLGLTATGLVIVGAIVGIALTSRGQDPVPASVASPASAKLEPSAPPAEAATVTGRPEPTATPTVQVTPAPLPDFVNHLYPVSWSDGVTVHSEPRKAGEAVEWLPYQTVVHVVCRTQGEAAVTKGGMTTHWWDWIDDPVSGYITDARINTGGHPPEVPLC